MFEHDDDGFQGAKIPDDASVAEQALDRHAEEARGQLEAIGTRGLDFR